ncbi:hypothetical protein [Cesiribacter sp. SM1]|uniref:hypothetical protein n=1 Tax=Cesiribacter sp. SM1 TaxID=2861196 RepID=UPI001CD36891|nr:hypothetical protein [Cesiribacter sp. SM1]
MKKSKICLQIFFLLLLAACAADKGGADKGVETAPAAVPDESVAVAVSDSVQFRDGDNSFWLRLNSIQDSRCPKDVNCITGGKAVAELAVGSEGAVANLCTGADCFGESGNSFLFRFNNLSYNIVLVDVLPYPNDGQESVRKQAILKIKRATG